MTLKSLAFLLLQCLFAPVAFGLGSTFILQWEMKQQGLTFSNFSTTAIPDDHISFLAIVVFMLVDALLYFVLTWYIEGVHPGQYGVAKPWYFPFMPSYWCGRSTKLSREVSLHESLQEDQEELLCKLQRALDVIIYPIHAGLTESGEEEGGSTNCEDEPKGLPLGISIQKISKDFFTGLLCGRRKKIAAVNDLSLNLYEGQITVILGHNGAGKTTTM